MNTYKRGRILLATNQSITSRRLKTIIESSIKALKLTLQQFLIVYALLSIKSRVKLASKKDILHMTKRQDSSSKSTGHLWPKIIIR